MLSLLSASADRDPLPVARQILQLFRADSNELVAVDNKASFRVMRSLLEKVRVILCSLLNLKSHNRCFRT